MNVNKTWYRRKERVDFQQIRNAVIKSRCVSVTPCMLYNGRGAAKMDMYVCVMQHLFLFIICCFQNLLRFCMLPFEGVVFNF